MSKNYISDNISYLLSKETTLNQDEFGILFDLKRGAINSYITNKATPKIETLLKICDHYNISLDDLVRKSLLEKNVLKNYVKEGDSEPYMISPRYVDLLEEQINILKTSCLDKDKIILSLEEKLVLHHKSKPA